MTDKRKYCLLYVNKGGTGPDPEAFLKAHNIQATRHNGSSEFAVFTAYLTETKAAEVRTNLQWVVELDYHFEYAWQK